jgi:predicted GTPase
VDTAPAAGLAAVRESVRSLNPRATVVEAASPITAEGAERIRGARVLVVEDGPTLTHGGMTYGAGTVLARAHGAAEIVDPRPWAAGKIRETFERYPGIGALLPAVGYGETQVRDLGETIGRVPCDLVIVATPVDLTRIVRIDKPMLRARYALAETTHPDLLELLRERMKQWPST